MKQGVVNTILGFIFLLGQVAYASAPVYSLEPVEGPIALSVSSTGIRIFSADDSFEDKAMVFEAYNLEDERVGVNLYPFADDKNILDWPLWNTYLGKNLLISDIRLKKEAMEIIERDPVLADIVSELDIENGGLRFRCWVEPSKDVRVGIGKDGVVLERLSLEVKVEAYTQGDSPLKDSFENRLAGLLKQEVLFGDEFSILRRTISAYFLGQGLRHMVKTQPEFRFLFGKRIMILGDKISFWKRDFLTQYMDLYLRAGKLGVSGGIRLYPSPRCFHSLVMKVMEWIKSKGKKIQEKIKWVNGSFKFADIETAIISAFKASGLSEKGIVKEEDLANTVHSAERKGEGYNVRNVFLDVIKDLVDREVISGQIGQELSWAIERIKEERLKDSGYEISYRLFSFVKEYRQLSDEKRDWVEKAFTNELAEVLLIAGVDPLILRDETYSVEEIKKRIDRKDLVEAGELLEEGIKINNVDIAPLELWELLLRLDRHIKKSVVKRKYVHLVDVINVMAMFLNKKFGKMTRDEKMKDAMKRLYKVFLELPEKDKKALIIGTILHDIGSIEGVRDMIHNRIGKILVRSFVKDKYSESLIDRISFVVDNHGIYADFASSNLFNDIAKLTPVQRNVVLLVHFFDSLRISVESRLDFNILKFFQYFTSGKQNVVKDILGDRDIYNNAKDFVVFRIGALFQGLVFLDSGPHIFKKGEKIMSMLSDMGVDVNDEFFSRWANVRINCRMLFVKLGEKSLERYAILLAQLDSTIRDKLGPAIKEVVIDTDVDVMKMYGNKDLLERTVEVISSSIANGKTIPIDIFYDTKEGKAKMVLKVRDLIEDSMLKEMVEEFLTKDEVNPEEIALFLGNLSEVERVLPVVLKEMGAGEGIVWDLVRYLISYKEEIFDRYGADVDGMKGKIQEQRLQDLLRECGLQEGLVEAMTNQDVETKREWFNNLVNILGLKGENISISMKQYDNAWKFLMDWAKDLSRIGVDFSSRLDENGELKKQIEGIYKAVLIGLIGEKVKIKDWVEEIDKGKPLDKKEQRGGVELIFQG